MEVFLLFFFPLAGCGGHEWQATLRKEMGVSKAVWMLGFSQECSTVLDFSTPPLVLPVEGGVCRMRVERKERVHVWPFAQRTYVRGWVVICVCAFLNSDGRIAILWPRRTDLVWESWKETTVCFRREMSLLHKTMLSLFWPLPVFVMFLWRGYSSSVSKAAYLDSIVKLHRLSTCWPLSGPYVLPRAHAHVSHFVWKICCQIGCMCRCLISIYFKTFRKHDILCRCVTGGMLRLVRVCCVQACKFMLHLLDGFCITVLVVDSLIVRLNWC